MTTCIFEYSEIMNCIWTKIRYFINTVELANIMSIKTIFDPANKYYIYLKGLLYLFTFQTFHFLYDLIPSVPLQIIAAIDESPWEHFKIGFYVYVIWTIIEYFAFKSKLERRQEYLFAGLLAAIILPWVIITIWFIMPAVYGPIGYYQEMVWAINPPLGGGYFVVGIGNRKG